MNILNLYKNLEINLDKTMTFSTNNGGVITAQMQDAFLFIQDFKLNDELEFLKYLASSKEKPSQDSIISFLRHLFFDAKLAKNFVSWQRQVA